MPFLKIVKPGFLTTIQDRGRFHYQKWGIPVAGAMDEYALRVGNLLVGNQENQACLEITLLGPEIEFWAPGLIALTGADLGAQLNGQSVETWTSFQVKEGDILRFTGIRSGCRAYLAAAGGFDVPVVMGSRSTYLRGKIGGLNGRALREGDVLEVNTSEQNSQWPPSRIPVEFRQQHSSTQVVRVVLGPQDDAFTPEGIDTFLHSEYTVTPESDRMGCRLEGPAITHREGPDIISDGIAMGSIQVPGNGKPIVMLADRQTTGGYAKIATVITPDLWKMAQAKPGDTISFAGVTLAEAHAAYKDYENIFRQLPDLVEILQH